MRRLLWLCLCLPLVFVLPLAASENDIDALLEKMTLEQKIGQLMMINLYGTRLDAAGVAYIQEMQPGGVALFGRNTDQTPQGIAELTNAIQQTALDAGGVPLLIAVDQEGGEVRRLKRGFTVLPDPLAWGAVTDDELITVLGAAVGGELNAVGINMNLAPVADLTTRDDLLNSMTVMHRRTWGDDAARVGELTAAYMAGLRAAGVMGALKHYPGHGGATDSHTDIPRVTLDETAANNNLAAFDIAIEQGADVVMVGHLYYTALEPEANLPATLSPTLMTILRDALNFAGVVLSDAMDMGAIKVNYGVPEAAVRFIQAGGDVFVTGPYMEWREQKAVRDALLEAVETGVIDEARIDASVRRILQLKADYGLLAWQQRDTANVVVATEATDEALAAVYQAAATLVKDDAARLPFAPDANITIVYPKLFDDPMPVCQSLAPNVEYIAYTLEPAAWVYGRVVAAGRDKDAVVIFTYSAIQNPPQQRIVNAAPPEKTIVVALNVPYDLEVFPEVSGYLALYTPLQASYDAACRALFGAAPITGRLPVTVGEYAAGHGILR